MSRWPVKIHVTPNLVAPAPALTSSVDYKSELFLVFLPLFPSINKLVLHNRVWHDYECVWLRKFFSEKVKHCHFGERS